MPFPSAARLANPPLWPLRKLFPQTPPTSVPSTIPPEELNTAGVNIAVNVRAPDAPLKRPVPPVM